MRDNDCTAYGSSSDFNCFADEKQTPQKNNEMHRQMLQYLSPPTYFWFHPDGTTSIKRIDEKIPESEA